MMHVFIRLAGCPSSGGRPSYRIVPVPRRTAGTLPIRAKRLRSRAVLNKNTQKMDKSVQLGRFFVGPRIRRSAKIKQNPVERMFNGVSVPRTGIEPARLAAHAPETCASTYSATWAGPHGDSRCRLPRMERRGHRRHGISGRCTTNNGKHVACGPAIVNRSYPTNLDSSEQPQQLG